jgi:hypothetical protein
MPKHPVIALTPNVPPAGLFQRSDNLSNLQRHTNQNSEGLGYDGSINMSNFVSVLSAIAAVYRWLRVRRVANKLEGTYVAENVYGRTLVPMPGAGLTVISPRPFWSPDPSILDVRGEDIDSGRGHHGDLRIDPGCLTARRTVDYDVPYERSGQQIEFDDDYGTLHVYPDKPDYGQHVLRRAKGILLLG